RLEQQGAPRDVFPRPASRFVAEFLGYDNFPELPGRGPVTIRPEHVRLLPAGEREADGDTGLDGTVSAVTYQGAGRVVEAGLHRADDLRPGDRVRIVLPRRHLVELPAGEQR